jgi:Uroporphyrinogen decarboxylase (URO-D)
MLGRSAQLALDTILQKSTRGIPTRFMNIMEHGHIERLAGVEPGTYTQKPEETYLACQQAIGACSTDQFIPRNPLTMGHAGYKSDRERTATTGAECVELDGMVIDSPEAVCEHLETFDAPALRQRIAEFDEAGRAAEIIERERATQDFVGPNILKSGYGFIAFPKLLYYQYGYENYFMAYALYPEVMENHFSLQADWAVLNNQAAARAYAEGALPPMFRLDHDMADSRGTLVSLESLEKLWFPHFARSIEPVATTNVRLLWHCDGNLMAMLPRLIDCGVSGFQGFQYEDGMDYVDICKMKDREERDLIILAGVSVTTTLPHGTPQDVRDEMKFLVEHGPQAGLFLGGSSSVAPGVPWQNMQALVEGLAYYREHGRG